MEPAVDDGQSFLQRWSRRKRAAEKNSNPTPERGASISQPPVDADPANIDFDALDFSSNYACFMSAQTPQAVRSKALRKLWASDAVFSEPDGLQDYAKDYTDAALRLSDAAQSAYRVGRGFLTDDELAAWAELAVKPTAAPGEAKTPEHRLDDDLHSRETTPECGATDASDDSPSAVVEPSITAGEASGEHGPDGVRRSRG